MTLDEALATARERGLKSLSLHVIGAGDKQYQISSKFAHSGGHHINIGPDLAVVLLQALNPPTGQNAPDPVPGPPMRPADTAIGLFD